MRCLELKKEEKSDYACDCGYVVGPDESVDVYVNVEDGSICGCEDCIILTDGYSDTDAMKQYAHYKESYEFY